MASPLLVELLIAKLDGLHWVCDKKCHLSQSSTWLQNQHTVCRVLDGAELQHWQIDFQLPLCRTCTCARAQ